MGSIKCTGSPLHREIDQKIPVRENTGNSVCLSPKFPDSKDQGYCDICCEISLFFFKELIVSVKFVLHMKFWSDRENREKNRELENNI